MKRSLLAVLFVAFIAAGATAHGTLFAEPANSMNSINFGIGGVVQTMPHCKADVFIAEYERMFGSKIALLGRISEVDYRFDDGKYLEEGRPKGVDIGARWYPAGGMKGFFIGGAVGYWMSDWTFTDFKGQPNEVQGRGDSDSIRVSLDIGGRFPIGSSSFSIIPALNVGRFFPSTTCEYTSPASKVGTSCSQRTEVENYLVLSVLAGIKF